MFNLYKSWLTVYLDKYHENAEYEMRRQRELRGTDQLGDEKYDKMIEASGGKKGPERIKRLRRQARYGNHPVTRERHEEAYKKYLDEGNKTGVWYDKEVDNAKQVADIKRFWASKKSYVNKYDEEEHELRRQREQGDNTKFTDREIELTKKRQGRYGTSKITNMRHEEAHENYLKGKKWWKKPTLSADNPKFKLTRDEQQQMGRKTGGTMLDYLHQQKEREEKKKPKPSGGFVIDEDDPDDVSNKSLYKSWLELRAVNKPEGGSIWTEDDKDTCEDCDSKMGDSDSEGRTSGVCQSCRTERGQTPYQAENWQMYSPENYGGHWRYKKPKGDTDEESMKKWIKARDEGRLEEDDKKGPG